MKMGTTIVNALSQKGTYSLVKQYEKDHKQHLIFRMYDKHMINYHDMELMRSNNKCQVADIFIYLNGENLSETMHGVYLQLSDEIGKEEAPWIEKLPQIRLLITANRHQEAMDIYKQIPDKAKKNRTFQILHINICSGLTDEEYAQAIQEYEMLYPNEPNMQLLMIDGYAMRKKYDKALEAVNGLDKMINKDPILDYYRAFCYSLLEDDVNTENAWKDW